MKKKTTKIFCLNKKKKNFCLNEKKNPNQNIKLETVKRWKKIKQVIIWTNILIFV